MLVILAFWDISNKKSKKTRKLYPMAKQVYWINMLVSNQYFEARIEGAVAMTDVIYLQRSPIRSNKLLYLSRLFSTEILGS